MNWSHFNTLLWVRWRITVNYLRRGGLLNLIIMTIGAVFAITASLSGFIVALIFGQQMLRNAPPAALMYVCDGWIAVFLFFWMCGVINELQRSEMLSIDKLLHLPTTLTEVFLFNFLGSLLTLTTLTFVPPLLGVSIAAVLAKGPAALVMFPLLAAFVLMICAVTYQFRGWLATLMQDKRRRQTVIVVITMSFVFLTQLPNVFNLTMQRHFRKPVAIDRPEDLQAKAELKKQMTSRKILPNEFVQKMAALNEQIQARRKAQNDAVLKQISDTFDIVNLVLPIGWMAYGAHAAAGGNPWPGLAGALGMAGIAAVSLRRSYRTTVRYFTGTEAVKHSRGAASVVRTPAPANPQPVRAEANLLERSLPLASEPVAAIAWGTLRALSRAPEVKMVLLSPLFMLVIYGGLLLSDRGMRGLTPMMQSFLPLGVLGLSIAGMGQLSHNCFGFDRAGFRTYVLSGVPRWQILLGKNLALVPLTCFLTLPALVLLQIFTPSPWGHFGASLLEIPTTFLTLSLLGNSCSIFCPLGQTAGSMKPANAKGLTMLLQFLFGLATLIVLAVVAVIPIGGELLLQLSGLLDPRLPLAPLLALCELAVTVGLYYAIIREQGRWLYARECQILEFVTERGE